MTTLQELNPYKDNTTKEGEFAYYSAGTDRGWKLVKDDIDPRKRVWHLVDTKNNKILDKKKGALTIGGNLSEWTKGGIRNVSNAFANLAINTQNERAIESAEMKAKGYIWKRTSSRSGKWVKDPNAKSGPAVGSDEYILANPTQYTSAMVRQAQRNIIQNNANNEAKGQREVDNGVVDETQNNKTPKEKVENNAAVKGSLERWQRGQGRTREQATNQSLAWLDEQGFDTKALRKAKYNTADLMEDLRIRGPHYTKNDQSMLRIGSGPDSILLKKIKKNNLKINQQTATPIIQ